MSVLVHLNRLDEWADIHLLEPHLGAAAQAALATSDEPLAGELSITLLPEPEIRELNLRYRETDAPTDVIAFRIGADEGLLGDVYVCPEVARDSAAEHGVTLESELARLVIHGVLHVLGHDHPEGEERWSSEMFRLQEVVLAGLETSPEGPGAPG